MATTDKDVEQLKADLDSLKSDMSEITQTLRRMTEQKASEGRDRVKSAAQHSLDPAEKALEATEQEIGQHPLTSVAASFGIGFLIGKLLGK